MPPHTAAAGTPPGARVLAPAAAVLFVAAAGTPPGARVLAPAAAVLFVAAAVSLQVAWIDACNLPTQVDTTTYTQNSIDYYRTAFLAAAEHPERLLFYDNVYPHVEYLVTAFFYHAFGISIATSRLSLLPWYALLLFSMYGCGRRLWGEWGGWLLMAAAACSPAELIFSKFYFLEAPMAAASALCLYLLLASEYLKSRPLSVLFGLSLGFSMMFKGSGLLFTAGVLAVAFFQHVVRDARPWPWRVALVALAASSPLIAKTIVGLPAFLALQQLPGERLLPFYAFFALSMTTVVLVVELVRRTLVRNGSLERAWNLLSSIAMALLVFFPWHAKNYATITQKVDLHKTLAPRDYTTLMQNVVDLENLVWLAKPLIVIGLIVCLVSAARLMRFLPLAGGAAISFLALSLTHQRDPRYMLPLLPLVLILALLWLPELGGCNRTRHVRLAALPLAAIFALQMSGWLLIDRTPLAGRILRPVTIFSQESREWGSRLHLLGLRIPTPWPPVTEPFHLDDALRTVAKAQTPGARPRVLLHLSFEGPFSLQDRNFPLEAELLDLDMEFTVVQSPEDLRDAGEGDFCIEAGRRPLPEISPPQFVPLASFPMPWENTLTVYKAQRR